MKKKFLFLILFVLFSRAFASVTFEDVCNLAGAFVMYEESDGNILKLLSLGDGSYYVQYFDQKSKVNTIARLKINKSFNTSIEYADFVSGDESFSKNELVAKVKNLFSFGDLGNRNNLPAAFVSEKTNLIDESLCEFAYMDFYIPITNVLKVEDKNGNVKVNCVHIGFVGQNDVGNLMNFNFVEKPIVRPMNKLNWKNTQSVSLGNICLDLPKDWTKADNGYFIKDTSVRDSFISELKIDLQLQQCADLYAFIALQLLTLDAWVVPDSFVMEKIGEHLYWRYDFADYNKYFRNVALYAVVSSDGPKLNCLCINGFSEFIEKNWSCYEEIIKSSK